MKSQPLLGKVAVVTGGASGIGAATVGRFRKEGAEVVVADLQEDAGHEVATETGAHFFRIDVAKGDDWRALSDLVQSRFGRLDVMFNNAGIMGIGKSIDNIDMATWDRVIGVNLTGVMLGCKHAIALMRKNPGGSSGAIINTASTTSYVALADDIAYCSAKSGVRILTKSVAIWCARNKLNIRCNSIHPGAIRTAIQDPVLAALEDPDQMLEALGNMSPMGRMGTPDEMAALALFLASEEASFITGGEYLADGGMLAVHPGL